jgi:hypothetical protein
MTVQWRRLEEESRGKRRTVADAIDLVVRYFGLAESPCGRMRVGGLSLPSGQRTYLVDIEFPELQSLVSLATSARFKARGMPGASPHHDVLLLNSAKVASDGSVVLSDGTSLRATEVVPTHLPYEPSPVAYRILKNVIAYLGADDCYRSVREGLPSHLRDSVPELRQIDLGRVRNLRVGYLKEIQTYIERNDSELKVSAQTISDALATFGVRIRRRRPRRSAQANATI